MAADFLHTTVTDRFETAVEVLQSVLAAGAYSLLLVVLLAGYYVVHQVE